MKLQSLSTVVISATLAKCAPFLEGRVSHLIHYHYDNLNIEFSDAFKGHMHNERSQLAIWGDAWLQ